jgi:TfoX/Sxy family transcriptional regulator of competence genes
MNLPTTIVVKDLYATLVQEFGILPGVTQWEKKRFGSLGLSIHGKIFVMLLKNKLVVKRPKARVDALIERRVGERFELGQKRMKEWVALSLTSEEDWLPLSREAMEFVASGR